ncbi:phage terminase large subunit family protein [Coraliomargarita sp. SDUM461003]|uniref:Phage terminase large subunit family protein n=1 Tax=Thalassobacterium maritimum TaxID=3041265 RepID=A0ABU1ARG3_9BACT|nr:terminase gpA endonuclease subunit [Coraliomargarita sp. SDUM461003]MDQ8206207.1 phage terminase large subunit family protein [Coraliomargarita sp. SDUM461003]
MNNSALQDLMVRTLAGIYRPGSDLSHLEWAEQSIVLSSAESIEFSGPYRADLTPWHVFVFEFFDDPAWRELIVRKSSQTGITLAMLIMICYFVAEMPAHVLYAIDSRDEAKKISKMRLLPMLKGCGACDGAMDVADDDLSTLFMMVRGMAIHIIGGGSAGAFANKTVKLCILDELDKHPANPQGEANTIDLARDRIKQVEEAKLVGFSSPKDWESVTNQEYLTGTRHKLFVPCPHCGRNQELVWQQMRFDHCKDLLGNWDLERVLKETYYECIGCGEAIEERYKPWMLDLKRVQFLPTNLNLDEHRRVPRKLSLHVSDLYSQFPESRWGLLAVQFIDASKNPSKLQAFFNGRMGLPKQERRVSIAKNDVFQLCGAYEHDTCPVWPAFSVAEQPAVVMASDVQQDVKKWAKGVFTTEGELYIVSYGETLSYDELEMVANNPTLCGPENDRREYKTSFGLIDEGHDTKNVRSFCLSTGGRWWPVKGRGGIQVRDVVSESSATHDGRELMVYHCSDDDFKTDLYVGRIGEFERIKQGKSPVPRMWLPIYVEERFVAELCAEKRERQKVRGRMCWVWVDPKDPNDFGDAVKYLLVLWYKFKELFPYDRPKDLRTSDEVAEN